jgi:hypothetical protein
VLVVEVDVVGPEAPQRGVAGLADVGGVAPHPTAAGLVGVEVDAELGGEDDLVAVRGERLADQLLVVAEAVHVGGVEERDAEREGPGDGGDRLVGVGGAVGEAHAHTAEALGGDGRAGLAEGARRERHGGFLPFGW